MSTTTSYFQWARTAAWVIFLGMTSLLQAASRQQLTGHVPKEIRSSSMIGEVLDNESFDLSIGLPLRNTDELQTLIQNLYDTHHPLYHQFLTPEDFTQRFGPTSDDYQKLIDFAEANGLVVTQTSPGRLLLNVRTTAANIRHVFNVGLHYYRRPDGREFRSIDAEPSIELDLPISHISGLQNAATAHSFIHLKNIQVGSPRIVTPNSKANPLMGTGPKDTGTNNYTYWGFDFRNIYACGSAETGAGQNIALFELDDYKLSNITEYENLTGIGSPSLTKVVVGSGFSSPGDGEDEVELDIEMAMSMSPGANIYVYETAGSDFDSLLNAIASPSQYGEPMCYQISCSWGWDDSTYDASLAGIFAKFAAQGQSFFTASGDTGAYVSDGPSTNPLYPIIATSLMTVVGGTTLSTSGANGTSVGTYTSETTWHDVSAVETHYPTPVNAVSSGGVCNSGSTPIPIPTYQVPFVTMTPGYASGASSVYRNIPDVAMIADEIAIYTTSNNHTGEFIGGGTSAAAPLWAALTAQINEYALTQTKGPIGLANYYLYNLASNATTYANDFNDIADGSNNNYWQLNTNLYKSVTGYDLTTGLGSPKCNLIANLVSNLATNTITPTPTKTYTPTNTPTATNTPQPPTTTTYYAYPQPAHGSVSLLYNSTTAQSIKIDVYNLMGQLVGTFTDNAQNSNQNHTTLSLQGFAPGVYYFVMTGSSGLSIKGKFLAEP